MRKFFIIGILAATLASCSPISNTSDTSKKADSILALTSQNSFIETDRKLASAIKRRALKTFAVIDHGKGAESVGQNIGQSKLYIFGNPKAGTPLMASNIKMGLELPLKMLITESPTGDVKISYKDILIVAGNYDIADKNELLSKISGNLAAIAKEATQ